MIEKSGGNRAKQRDTPGRRTISGRPLLEHSEVAEKHWKWNSKMGAGDGGGGMGPLAPSK